MVKLSKGLISFIYELILSDTEMRRLFRLHILIMLALFLTYSIILCSTEYYFCLNKLVDIHKEKQFKLQQHLMNHMQ